MYSVSPLITTVVPGPSDSIRFSESCRQMSHWEYSRASIWLRTTAPLPDSPALHRALLAYASDHGLLLTATLPHGLSLLKGEVRMASIDHAMWFHRDFRIDEWLLYQVDSPTVRGNRALCRGMVFSRDGKLVASTMQEGLIRTRSGATGRGP